MKIVEKEFKTFAEDYKNNLLKQKLIDFYMTLIAPYDLSDYPDFIQKMAIDFSTALADLKIENIKLTGENLANKVWDEELKKAGIR